MLGVFLPPAPRRSHRLAGDLIRMIAAAEASAKTAGNVDPSG
jgi:hypothetical protein